MLFILEGIVQEHSFLHATDLHSGVLSLLGYCIEESNAD